MSWAPASPSTSPLKESPLKESFLKASSDSLASSGGLERKELSPVIRFKKAELDDSLRAIFNIDSESVEDTGLERSNFQKRAVAEQKKADEDAFSASEDEGKEKGKGKGKGRSPLQESQQIIEESPPPLPEEVENDPKGSPGSSKWKDLFSAEKRKKSVIGLDTTLVEPSPPGSPVPPIGMHASSDNLITKPKLRSSITDFATRFFLDRASRGKPKQEEEEKPKQTRLLLPPTPLNSDKSKRFSKKPFERVDSFQSIRDKRYRAVLEQHQHRIITEVPRVIQLQVIEEAYPIILKMCQEYIKNLGEKHEITIVAMERLNLMAKELGRDCEYPLP